MTGTRSRIQVRELPPRSTALSTEQLGAVMGGCMGHSHICEVLSDCCEGFTCTYIPELLVHQCRP